MDKFNEYALQVGDSVYDRKICRPSEVSSLEYFEDGDTAGHNKVTKTLWFYAGVKDLETWENDQYGIKGLKRVSKEYLNLFVNYAAMEEWRFCPGLSKDLQVSNLGRVRTRVRSSLHKKKVLCWVPTGDLEYSAGRIKSVVERQVLAWPGYMSAGVWEECLIEDYKWRLLTPKFFGKEVRFRVSWNLQEVGKVPGLQRYKSVGLFGENSLCANMTGGATVKEKSRYESAGFLAMLAFDKEGNFFQTMREKYRELCERYGADLQSIRNTFPDGIPSKCKVLPDFQYPWYDCSVWKLRWFSETECYGLFRSLKNILAQRAQWQGEEYRGSGSVVAYPLCYREEFLEKWNREKEFKGVTKKSCAAEYGLNYATAIAWITADEREKELQLEFDSYEKEEDCSYLDLVSHVRKLGREGLSLERIVSAAENMKGISDIKELSVKGFVKSALVSAGIEVLLQKNVDRRILVDSIAAEYAVEGTTQQMIADRREVSQSFVKTCLQEFKERELIAAARSKEDVKKEWDDGCSLPVVLQRELSEKDIGLEDIGLEREVVDLEDIGDVADSADVKRAAAIVNADDSADFIVDGVDKDFDLDFIMD